MHRVICPLLLLLNLSLNAQYNSLGFGAGTSFFRGETTATGSILEEPGINLYGYYTYWLPADERFQITGMLDLDFNRPQIASPADGSELYEAYVLLISPLVGMRFYWDRWLLDYVPEKNQSALFLGLYLGPAIYLHDYQSPGASARDVLHYTNGFGISFNSSAEIGYRIFRNSHWSYEISTGFKYGFNDAWDGLKGNTAVNDWLFHLKLGMSYSFYQWQ